MMFSCFSPKSHDDTGFAAGQSLGRNLAFLTPKFNAAACHWLSEVTVSAVLHGLCYDVRLKAAHREFRAISSCTLNSFTETTIATNVSTHSELQRSYGVRLIPLNFSAKMRYCGYH